MIVVSIALKRIKLLCLLRRNHGVYHHEGIESFLHQVNICIRKPHILCEDLSEKKIFEEAFNVFSKKRIFFLLEISLILLRMQYMCFTCTLMFFILM